MESSSERARFRRHWVSQKVWAYWRFERSFGGEVGMRSLQKAWYGVDVFGGQDDDAAGQAVAQGVHSWIVFAFGGAGSGGLVGLRGCGAA